MHERAKIIDLTTDSVIKTNRDGIVTMWNRGAERIFGYTSEEMIGQPIGTLYREQEQGRLAEIVETLLRGEEITTTEVTCVHKNGSLIELALSVLPFKDDNGNVTDFVGISKDISDRKKAQEALLRSENRYRTVIENAGEGIVVVQDGMLRFINSQQTSVAGRSQEESMSRPFIEFVHPDDRQRVAEFHTARLRGEHVPSVYEFRIIDKNGRTKWLENNGVLIEWNGRPASLNFLRDITIRKNAEEALREREEMIRAMVETSRDWIWSIDLNGIHTYCNPAVERILGYSPDELVGKRSLDLIHNDDRRTIEAILPTWIAEKRGWSNLMLRWKHKDGTYRYLESNAVPILSSENELVGFRGVDRDVTERKRMEEELRIKDNAIASSITAITIAEFDGNLTYANDAFLKMWGYDDLNEVLGKSAVEFWNVKDNAMEIIERLRGGDSVIDELVGKRKDGSLFYAELSASAVTDESGTPVYMMASFMDITERKKAQKALRESENRYRTVIEHAGEGITVTQDGISQLANSHLATIVGCSEEEIISRPFIEFVHPDDREKVKEIYSRRLQGQEVPPVYDLRIIDKQGTTKWIENNGVQIEWNGRVATLNFLRDITERKQAEEALRESEEKFRSLAEQSPNMIFINRRGKIVYVNNRCEEVMGYTREEFCSPNFDFRTLVTPESLDLINDNFSRHLRGEDVRPYDYSIIRKDGKRIEAINTSKLIQYEGQSAILGIVTDITERKKSEQALRESEERLKILFESAPEAIYLIDPEGRFVDGNKAAEDLIGLEKTEVIGKSLAELGLLPARQLSKAQTNLRKVAAGKLSGPNEYTIKRQDGSHISVEVRTFPVKIGGKLLTLGIARDITEHKRTEKKLLEHQAKLKSLASRLSLAEERERYRLATDLHDQISQSLVISKIKLDQLCKSSGSEEFNKSLKDISNCLGQVIDDTRALTFDLSYPILYELGFEAAVAEWLTDQIQVKHGIETEFVDDGHKKPLDDDIRVLLFRNVRELLINVVKHAQPKKVKVSINRIKDNIRIIVEDDGVGFDPVEVMSMSAKRAKFGLFSVRERLEQLGGSIDIDSDVGRGSKITMTAPLKN
jgi:PAS domain S-box-containing protein